MTNMTIDRRRLMQGAASVGSVLLLGVQFDSSAGDALAAVAHDPTPVTAWVVVGADNEVTLLASQSEMGQGATTTLAAALAHELHLPLDRVRVEFSPFGDAYRDPVYHWMFTGNSQSTSSFYELMRRMGAAAREMLMTTAAGRLKVPAQQLTMQDGRIVVAGTTRSVTFAEIAGEAAALPVPAKPTPRPDEIAGHAIPRWDIPAKTDGSAVFGIDVTLPGMLIAAVRNAPRFGGKPAHYDAAAIKRHPGVQAVVALPHGLAVVATTYWQARRALDGAAVAWRDDGATLTSGNDLAPVYAEKMAAGPFFTHKRDGDASAALATAATRLAATYRIPFQAHATMEPMNCTARVADGRCDIWAPTQGVEMAQHVAMQVTGLSSDKIVIHRTFLGGGFGRRLLADFVQQTLMVAMAVKAPVKMIWSREEDMSHDFYRPGMLHAVSGALDGAGQVTALTHRVVSPSHMLYIFPRSIFPGMRDWTEPAAPPEKYDAMAVEGLVEIPYDIANQTVEQHRLALDVPVSVWRTTGHGPNNFVLESFVDELAGAAKTDPLVFRRRLLTKNPRARRLLDLAAEKSGWDSPLPPGRGRGVALAVAFGGMIANVVELSVNGGEIKLHRVVAAVDCGRTLDPGIAQSNILGGIVWGLSGMVTEMTFKDGAATSFNFDAFTPLHLWETPSCEVHFLDGGGKLGGTGELGPVPVHAAVCNAIFAATGKRIRALPLSAAGLSFA
jgi:isoquinoline 1-oxidoreductase beta subunit